MENQILDNHHQNNHDPDEINLLEYIYALLKIKWWIIGFSVFGLLLGYAVALKKGPKWVVEVTIAPKETESQKGPNLSGLGALGGLVASQINMGGNASLEKIDLLLDSRKFNAAFVQDENLLPFIYKYQWPKMYKLVYDTILNKWKPGFKEPELLGTGGMIKEMYLKKLINKNATMTIKIQSKDSTLSLDLAQKFIDYLNTYIKTNVQNDAKENVNYLENQLLGVSDPLLREKLQTIIANEIEKQMIVSKEAFRIIDPPYMGKTFKEKKMYPLVFGFGLFFMTCLGGIILHAFSTAQKTEEDKQLLEKIKKELLFFIKK
jgi:LPS O-antigen subunit length determinant protein (WzzB/FepE family)